MEHLEIGNRRVVVAVDTEVEALHAAWAGFIALGGCEYEELGITRERTLTRRSLQFRQPRRDFLWAFRFRSQALEGSLELTFMVVLGD